MNLAPRPRASVPSRLAAAGCTVLAALLMLSCSDSSTSGGGAGVLELDSTRLCALVPARDAAAAAFPPSPPVKVFGTDLGWTYQAPDGSVPILFGDSWQRIDICPIQTNDDSLACSSCRRTTGPGSPRAVDPGHAVPEVAFEVDAGRHRVRADHADALGRRAVPMGPLNTPLGGFPRRPAGVGHLHRRRRSELHADAGGERCRVHVG